jgi:hypothetical protein
MEAVPMNAAPDAAPKGEIDLLRDFLSLKDVACPACGHNLRGASGTACPECGLGLNLRVTIAELPHGAWVWSVIAVAASFGFSATLTMGGLYAAYKTELYALDRRAVVAAGCSSLVSVIVLAILAKRRAAMGRKSRVSRWAWAMLILVLAGMLHVGLVLFMSGSILDFSL